MPNLGLAEIIIILLVLAIIGIPIVAAVIAAVAPRHKRALPGQPPAASALIAPPPRTAAGAVPQPRDLPGVAAAMDRGDWRVAVDLYRQVSGLPHQEAEDVVMAAGEPGPAQGNPGAGGARSDQPDGDDWPTLPPRNRD